MGQRQMDEGEIQLSCDEEGSNLLCGQGDEHADREGRRCGHDVSSFFRRCFGGRVGDVDGAERLVGLCSKTWDDRLNRTSPRASTAAGVHPRNWNQLESERTQAAVLSGAV